MNNAQSAVLSSWTLDPFLLFGLCLTLLIYFRGWRILGQKLPERFPAWRLYCFAAGLLTFYVAVASPLDAFASFLLQIHMIQHLMLTVVAPPLLLLGAPFLPLIRGLPRVWARELVAPLLNGPVGHICIRFFGHPLVAWMLFVGSMLIWHIPGIYDLALSNNSWHAAEHFCFFFSGLIFWHHIVLPWPARSKMSRWLIIPYILSADLLNTALAAFLSFYDQGLYATYASAPRLWGISVLDDQSTAGVIMWVPGSVAFLLPAFFITAKLLSPKGGVRPSQAFTQPSEQPKSTRPAKPPRGISALTKLAKSPVRRFVQVVMLLLALAVIVDGFLGPKPSSMNLAGVLPWTYWRGFSVLALLTLGNFFCSVCPFTFFRDVAQRFLPAGKKRQWPKKLANKWLAAALLITFLWAYEVFDLWDRPMLTACLIIGYFGSILLVDSLFRKGSFCKYLCPIGQYHFAFSTLSSSEIKVVQPDVCASCTTQDCLRGNAKQSGCETALFLPSKAGNLDCTYCLDCVRACPHDNISAPMTIPGRDLASDNFHSTLGKYGERSDLAALMTVFCAGAFINAAGMTAPVNQLISFLKQWGLPESASVTLFILLGVVAVPLGLGYLAAWISQLWFAPKKKPRELMVSFAYGFVPIGASLWAAHFLFHLATGAFTIVPIVQRIMGQLSGGDMSQAMAVSGPAGFAGPWILNLEFLLVDLGYLVSMYVIWRISERVFPQKRLGGFLIWASLATVLLATAIWILFQPMEMRGMPG